ncbi:MAG: ribosome biogenesis GTP-binding protein YihA/YsxC [Pseudomonadota bacterium]
MVGAASPKQFPPADRPEIAFAGRSNVGKSSLLNSLLQRRKLARTSSSPGRTQQINFFDISGNLYFVDLPGYGYAKAPLSVRASWRPLVDGYLTAPRDLRLVLLLNDIRRDPGEEEANLLTWLESRGLVSLLVITKADKVSRGRQGGRAALIAEKLSGARGPVLFSALSGIGRREIWEHIASVSAEPAA